MHEMRFVLLALPLAAVVVIAIAVVVATGWGGLLVLAPAALLAGLVVFLGAYGGPVIQEIGRAFFDDRT